ncbi:MAG: flavoprotein, partial [Rhizobiales bacterium]|nr:flavoprotein [Hyphomicrobiales bacterium]
AAAHLIARGVPVTIFEAASRVGENIRDWGHVRLFSVWDQCIDQAAAGLLERHGWKRPEGSSLPTGGELVKDYLEPLAATPEIARSLKLDARVTRVSRAGLDRMSNKERGTRPFVLRIESANGRSERVAARAVIDASGTWQHPNPAGPGGWHADGERENASRIAYGIPDIGGTRRADYAGKRTLVLGGGHSAANALLDLALLAESAPGTRLTWAVRGTSLAKVFGGGESDQLPARGALGARLRALTTAGRLETVTGFTLEAIEKAGEAMLVTGTVDDKARQLGLFDRIIVATGQRPGFEFARELQLDLHPVVESSRALGPLIDPNEHSCGTVPPHGWRELAHPEPDYFIAGIKSYGRAPTFLLLTGYEQVRSVAAHLAGDHAAADDVRLVLPETGVCNATLEQVAPGGLCCDGAAPDAAEPCCERPPEAAKTACCSGPAPQARTACCGVSRKEAELAGVI